MPLLLAPPMLPNPIANNIRHSLPIQRTFRVLLIILGAQIPQGQKDPVLHKLVVDHIHSLWRSGSVGWVETYISCDAVGDVVEFDGFVDGVVAVAAEVVDGGVAGDGGFVGVCDGAGTGEGGLVVWAEEEVVCGRLGDEGFGVHGRQGRCQLVESVLGYGVDFVVACCDQIFEENLVLVVQEPEDLACGLVWDAFGHSEAARERRDEEGAIDCERSLEDVEAHSTRVCDDDRRAVAAIEGCWEDFLLEPCQ